MAPDPNPNDARIELEKDIIASSEVNPNWLPGGDKFWYRRQVSGADPEYFLVEAAGQASQRKLTKAALAEELKKLTGEEPNLDPPLAEEDNASSSEFDSVNPKGKFLTQVAPSTFSLASLSLRIVNRCSCSIKVSWVDYAGQAEPRATLKAGQSRQFEAWQGHAWKIKGDVDENAPKFNYFTSKEESKDILVVNDDLLWDRNDARGRKPELFPFISVWDNAVWVKTESGDEHKISSDGDKEELYDDQRIYLSSDERFVVVWHYTPEQEHKIHLVESSPADQVEPKLHSMQYLKPGDQVRVDRPRLFDLEAFEEVATQDDLFNNPFEIINVGWNAKGTEYRFIYNERGHQHYRLLGMSTDGKIRTIVEESSKTFIDYSFKAYHHVLKETDEIVWTSERQDRNHVYLYDATTGELKNQITKGEFIVHSVERVDDEKRQMLFKAYAMVDGQDPYYAHLARINLDGSGLTILTEGDGTHTWKWSTDHRYLLDTYSRVDYPPETTLRNSETGEKILTLVESQLERLTDWTAPERFSTTARDGTTPIYGIILRPPNFDANKKYPILEEHYAGPHGFFTPKSFKMHPPFVTRRAGDGFVVVRVDGLGTNWRGKAFHDVCYKNLHDAGLPDHIKFMRDAAATRPWMDLSRVGIHGCSAGGQSVGAALIHHGDFYKVGAADCGCHDNRMDKIWWNEQWMGWPVDGSYEAASNIVHAGKITGKLLLVVGEMDKNVDPSSTYQFANALNKAGIQYEMLLVPGGGHGCGFDEYGEKRQSEFFKRHLLRED